MKFQRRQLAGPLFAVVLLHFARCATGYRFSACEDKVRGILNGTQSDGAITNVTIRELDYIYHGPLQGLKPTSNRSEVLSLTMQGCKVLCNDPIEVAEPANALSLTATWVFPLAIIFNLPYETYHSRKVWNTLKAVLNWLGSPQSALAATLWNFSQIRRCARRAKAKGGLLRDALYVLSCLNQFDLLEHVPRQPRRKSVEKKPAQSSSSEGDSGNETGPNLGDPTNPGGNTGTTIEDGVNDEIESAEEENAFFKVLVYGLFRPQAHIPPALQSQLQDDAGNIYPIDVVLTEELLVTLAYQLRMLRRRGVLPTFFSLVMFLVAFIFSVVLTFGNFDDDNINVIYMSIGLFVLWLPILVMFSIADRNPVSSERSAMLISRWMYNVNVVRTWAREQGLRPSVELLAQLEGRWWTRNTELHGDDGNNAESHELTEISGASGSRSDPALSTFPVGKFIGQGRSLQYCGLVHAVLSTTVEDPEKQFGNSVTVYDACGGDVADFLARHKPGPWWGYAALSFGIVWTEIGMAVMLAWNTPTIGPGCWSGSCFLYGALSSMAFCIQACTKRFGKVVEAVTYVFNGAAFFWLLATIVLQLVGVFNNCYCFSSPFGKVLGLGGYMDFGNSIEYRNDYNVISYWVAAAAIGGLALLGAVGFAIGLWSGCSELWTANEEKCPRIAKSPVYEKRVRITPETQAQGGDTFRVEDRITVQASTRWLQG